MVLLVSSFGVLFAFPRKLLLSFRQLGSTWSDGGRCWCAHGFHLVKPGAQLSSTPIKAMSLLSFSAGFSLSKLVAEKIYTTSWIQGNFSSFPAWLILLHLLCQLPQVLLKKVCGGICSLSPSTPTLTPFQLSFYTVKDEKKPKVTFPKGLRS